MEKVYLPGEKDFEESLLSGWHKLESHQHGERIVKYRWTEKEASLKLAANCLKNALWLLIDVSNNRPRIEAKPFWATVELAGVISHRFKIDSYGIHTERIYLPQVGVASVSEENTAELKIRCDEAWCPRDAFLSPDSRQLGLAVYSIRLAGNAEEKNGQAEPARFGPCARGQGRPTIRSADTSLFPRVKLFADGFSPGAQIFCYSPMGAHLGRAQIEALSENELTFIAPDATCFVKIINPANGQELESDFFKIPIEEDAPVIAEIEGSAYPEIKVVGSGLSGRTIFNFHKRFGGFVGHSSPISASGDKAALRAPTYEFELQAINPPYRESGTSRKVYYSKIEENLLINSKDRSQGKLLLESMPPFVYMELDLKCNISCPSCARPRGPRANKSLATMGLDIFQKAASSLFLTASRVYLSGGGESLLNPHFDDMLGACLDYNFIPMLYTNGTLFTEKRARLLVEAGVYLGISLDGARKKTFENLRRGASYEGVIKGIERLNSEMVKGGNKRFSIFLQVVAQRANIDELPEIVKLAHSLSIREVRINEIIIYNESLKGEELNAVARKADKMKIKALEAANKRKIRCLIHSALLSKEPKMIEYYEELKRANDFLLPIDDFTRPGEDIPVTRVDDGGVRPCYVPWTETFVAADGSVLPSCCGNFILGCLRDKPFEEIWNGEAYLRLRESVNSAEPMEFCKVNVCHLRLKK